MISPKHLFLLLFFPLSQIARDSVRVNCLWLDSIDTSIHVSQKDCNMRPSVRTAHVPMSRSGISEEVASAALFLVSDDSSYITALVCQ